MVLSRCPTPHLLCQLPVRNRTSYSGGHLVDRGRKGVPPLHSSDLVSLGPACSFTQAMLSQPRMDSLDNPTAYWAGLALLAAGSVLVLSSFFALGFTGTFLGKTPRSVGP